jgi:FlaA1/EpsC-like NDP-sugar epimerase
MSKIRLLVVGAGGHGRAVAEAAELSGQFEVVGFLDDALPAGKSVFNMAVLGTMVSMDHNRAAAGQTIVQLATTPFARS